MPLDKLRPLCLAYHGIGDYTLRQDRNSLFTSPRQLRRDIGLLRSWGYSFSTFGAWADAVRQGSGSGLVSLTFDDGFADNHDTLLPLLQSEKVPATIFPVVGWLGRQHLDAPFARVMTADELRAVHQEGIEIGAHTIHHPNLTRVSRAYAFEELSESRKALELLLDAPVEVAAYPYGLANDDVRAAAEEAGFAAACCCAGLGSFDDPLDLPRDGMGNGTSRLGLKLRRDGRYEATVRRPGMWYVRRASRQLHNAAAMAAARRNAPSNADAIAETAPRIAA